MINIKNILLVDDDEDDQSFFKAVVMDIDKSLTISLANNGAQAMAMLKEVAFMPDVIFMDLNMPKMGGLECLGNIRKQHHLLNIPVFILTTTSDATQKKQAVGAGASGFFTKPPTEALLKKYIGEAFSAINC